MLLGFYKCECLCDGIVLVGFCLWSCRVVGFGVSCLVGLMVVFCCGWSWSVLWCVCVGDPQFLRIRGVE